MRHRTGAILVVIGTILLLAALSLLAYNKWDAWRAAKSAADIETRLKEEVDALLQNSYDGELPDGSVVPDDEDVPELATVEVDGYEYIGTLSINRFGLELPVMKEWSYPGLKIAPGRYAGSPWTDDFVICGHNYSRHFGNLKYLEAGDEVDFTDVLGNVFTYEVVEVETLQPTAIEEMLDDQWDLTLFTCTIGGRTRVTVRCMQIS